MADIVKQLRDNSVKKGCSVLSLETKGVIPYGVLSSGYDGLQCRDCWEKAWNIIADRIESEFLQFPCGKDGKVIHIGDKVFTERNQDGFVVFAIDFTADGEVRIFSSEDSKWALAEVCSHMQLDSWERIEADIARITNKATAQDVLRRCKILAGV